MFVCFKCLFVNKNFYSLSLENAIKFEKTLFSFILTLYRLSFMLRVKTYMLKLLSVKLKTKYKGWSEMSFKQKFKFKFFFSIEKVFFI